MNEDSGFSLHRRGTHPLAGRTILQIVGTLDALETDRAALDVAGALAEAGARPLVAAPAGRLVSELQAKGGVWLDFPAQAKNPLAMLLNIGRLKSLLAREHVDLVHVRARPAGWVAYAATRSGRVPLVTSLQQLAPGGSLIKQRYNAVLAKGAMVIAGSKFAAATIADLYPAAYGRIALIRPAIDLKPFTAATIQAARVQALRNAWQVAPEERIVLMTGRPSVWKGHKVAVEALKLLGDDGLTDLKLVFVGDGKGGGKGGAKEVDQAIKTAGLTGRVRKVDACGDMPAALLAASVVLVPSIEPEAFGRTAIEAQALGTPVVVSDIGAATETVLAPPDTEATKRTGWRVAPSDPVALADAMRDALALGASGHDALALRARKQVEARFAIERMARETLDVYASVLDRHAAPA